MKDALDNKPPTSFWVIAGAALVWNLMGLLAYYMQVTMGPDMLAEMTEAQQRFYTEVPVWATSAFAVAVTAGVLGSILLLLRKAVAVPVFVLSLVGVLVQNTNAWLLADGLAVFGPGGAVMPALVILIAIALIVYSRKAKADGTIS
jgi:hypothetical protein